MRGEQRCPLHDDAIGCCLLQQVHAWRLVRSCQLGKSSISVGIEKGRPTEVGDLHFEIVERFGLGIDEVVNLDPSVFESYHWRLKRSPFSGWRGVQILIATYIGAKCDPARPWWQVWPYAKETFFDDFLKDEQERWNLLPPKMRTKPREDQDRYIAMRYGKA